MRRKFSRISLSATVLPSCDYPSPAAFRSNISDIKHDLAFSTAIQYGPVKNWRDEDWGDIKFKAQAYEDTGRSLSDYMAGVKAELDKLKAG